MPASPLLSVQTLRAASNSTNCLTGISSGEAVQTFAALVHLQPTHAVAAFAFSDGLLAIELRTRRTLLRVLNPAADERCVFGCVVTVGIMRYVFWRRAEAGDLGRRNRVTAFWNFGQ